MPHRSPQIFRVAPSSGTGTSSVLVPMTLPMTVSPPGGEIDDGEASGVLVGSTAHKARFLHKPNNTEGRPHDEARPFGPPSISNPPGQKYNTGSKSEHAQHDGHDNAGIDTSLWFRCVVIEDGETARLSSRSILHVGLGQWILQNPTDVLASHGWDCRGGLGYRRTTSTCCLMFRNLPQVEAR